MFFQNIKFVSFVCISLIKIDSRANPSGDFLTKTYIDLYIFYLSLMIFNEY